MSENETIDSRAIDELFDANESPVLQHFDTTSIQRPGLAIKRVNVDMPQWMVIGLENEAQRLGISRQSVIKTWLAEKIDNGSRVDYVADAH